MAASATIDPEKIRAELSELWVTLANGFRFGRPYLLLCLGTSVAGMVLALLVNEFWQANRGVWAQPLLGRVADVWGYGPSYVVGAAIAAIALPALALSRRQNAPADVVQTVGPSESVPA